MKRRPLSMQIESLESRRLFAWSAYAQLVDQDLAAASYSNITGEGIAVAVIDTGINYNLSILGGGFGAGKKVVAGKDFYDDDSNPMDSDGHGTKVAAAIAAEPYTFNGVTYQGVAPDAKLVALRVGTADNIPNENIEAALRWVIDHYTDYNIKVINLSVGQGNYTSRQTSNLLSDELQELHDLGIFVVAASGNSNDQDSGPISQDGIAYPAADPNAFAVGAVDSSDVIADWVQRSIELDLLAPGVDIVLPEGNSYDESDGTSFASPYVAGAAALIYQADPTVKAGDVGSILMTSGVANRDGDSESGNTTGLLFGRLDIDGALALTAQRKGVTSSLALGSSMDTALDSQGVLHAAYYDYLNGDLLYATRNTSGFWSNIQIIDSAGNVGTNVSIAVDSTGRAGIAYFDATNADLKYAGYNGSTWSTSTIDSDKHVGTAPSIVFDVDGNAYISYHRRTGGYLRLARYYRDRNAWARQTIDGGSGAVVGLANSIDVGEAAIRSGGFTFYDTTVAIAYGDVTNGDLKYARLDVDDTQATWFTAVVDNTGGVSNIDLNLHDGSLALGLQAQIAYQDVSTQSVKYAYRNTDWFIETVRAGTQYGGSVQISFDDTDRPMVTFYDRFKKALYTSTRLSSTRWIAAFNTVSSLFQSVSLNERTGETSLSWINRERTALLTSELL